MNTANQTPDFQAMSRPRKTAVVILAFLGVAVIIFWVWQFRSQLRQPFNPGFSGQPTVSTATDSRGIDSDSDGLSDYDEINVYQTSPYLEDSDSDNISDLKEIQQGTDPNCPQGKNCSASDAVASSTAGTSVNQDSYSDDNLGLNLSADVVADTSTLQKMVSGQLDAASLRQLLIQNGADKASLDKISDEDLLSSYQETLDSQNTQINQ